LPAIVPLSSVAALVGAGRLLQVMPPSDHAVEVL
jgi:hypothetical protein